MYSLTYLRHYSWAPTCINHLTTFTQQETTWLTMGTQDKRTGNMCQIRENISCLHNISCVLMRARTYTITLTAGENGQSAYKNNIDVNNCTDLDLR